jgi:hypothetical protein
MHILWRVAPIYALKSLRKNVQESESELVQHLAALPWLGHAQHGQEQDDVSQVDQERDKDQYCHGEPSDLNNLGGQRREGKRDEHRPAGVLPLDRRPGRTALVSWLVRTKIAKVRKVPTPSGA